jgi:hypothetical protein
VIINWDLSCISSDKFIILLFFINFLFMEFNVIVMCDFVNIFVYGYVLYNYWKIFFIYLFEDMFIV